jgi:succinate dehydrogenase/fumarate reductase flavoprotein subunit
MTNAQSTVTCDVLVIGSGAAGMATAITARHHGLDVLVVEKEAQFGGTTAISGGHLWIPANPVATREGITDSIEAARIYLAHEAGPRFDAERIDAFLENGPQMVAFFEQQTAVRFISYPTYADSHAEAPGGHPGGRTLVAAPFDLRALGTAVGGLRPPMREITFHGMMTGTGAELQHYFKATKSLRSAAFVAWRLLGYGLDLMRHGRGMRVTNGNALTARLMKSAIDLGIPLWLSAPARGLLTAEVDGSIEGALVERNGTYVVVRARRGVVLACGGFPRDPLRCAALFGHEHTPLAPFGNTGDGLRMAEAIGARLDEDLVSPAVWAPVSRVPQPDGSVTTFPHFVDRPRPGVIAVTRHGRRFVNEAHSYHDFIQALIAASEPHGESAEEITAFLVCDHRTIRRYGLGIVGPFPLPLSPHLASGYLLRGRTIAELAERAGIDSTALERTIEAFNGPARDGQDPQFGKGSTAYNRHQGDNDNRINPCVAAVEDPPFYAIRVGIGHLGTLAGIRTDACARALDDDGRPLIGLYAVGNDMASIMGGSYPGSGVTLGPAMTFGFIAGRHLAGIAGPVERRDRTSRLQERVPAM